MEEYYVYEDYENHDLATQQKYFLTIFHSNTKEDG